MAVRNSQLEGFRQNVDEEGCALAARNAIPAKIWALSGEEKAERAAGKSALPSGALLDFSKTAATFLSFSELHHSFENKYAMGAKVYTPSHP